MAYLLYDNNGNKITEGNHIIKPDRFTIPLEASRVHGITTDRANREGKELINVLKDFQILLNKAECLVAHNMSFDEKVIGAEFLRNQMTNGVGTKRKICTMEKTTIFCAINGPYGYKWPKLSELYFKLFGETFEEAHNAFVDIKATAKCYWELKKRSKI
ncbi:3'-5' exonuclease [Solitalea lacus]|nr:3'-5' exonuclease [Solitalea lacus]